MRMKQHNKIVPKSVKGGIFVDPERKPWPHEMRTARTLALAGYSVRFLPESSLMSADILLDKIESGGMGSSSIHNDSSYTYFYYDKEKKENIKSLKELKGKLIRKELIVEEYERKHKGIY